VTTLSDESSVFWLLMLVKHGETVAGFLIFGVSMNDGRNHVLSVTCLIVEKQKP
jgi:hypothetical protein